MNENYLEQKARELAQARDVMPKTLKEHQDNIYGACLDMAYIIEKSGSTEPTLN